ncbi:MAG: phosphoribosylglycinamide formyltransferase [Syntrophales bacterium]
MAQKVPIGVLVSGSGSNLQSIIDHIEVGRLDAEIRVIVSNEPEAYALQRAAHHHISSVIVRHGDFTDRQTFEEKIVAVLSKFGVELVIMAGFMRILGPTLLRAFPLRIMNIHPALLPAFPGLHVQQKAIDYGVKFSGCTVHFADEGVDAGPIIIQAIVPVLDSDTAEDLAARILKEEHKIYPQAIQLYAEGRLEIKGRRVMIKAI